jgi:pantothenate synthetase
MSSRNERSSEEEREAALIYKTLAEAKENLQPTVFQLFPNGYKNVSRQSSFYFRIFHYC